MPSSSGQGANESTQSSWTTQDANVALHHCLSKRHPPLPNEIILQILEHPSRWLQVHSKGLNNQSTESPKTRPLVRVPARGSDANITVLLSTDKLEGYHITGLRKLVFKFRSRDQGWSSYPEYKGTFNHSWTWFEAGIRKDGAQRHTGGLNDDELEGKQRSYEYPRHLLQRNRHAMREPESYNLEFGPNDSLVTALKEGDAIDLLACAQYPGWENIIYEASIDLWCVDDLGNHLEPSS